MGPYPRQILLKAKFDPFINVLIVIMTIFSMFSCFQVTNNNYPF